MNTSIPVSVSDEDQQSFNRLASDFAAGVLADSIHDHEYPYRLDPSIASGRIGELGFLSMNLPAAYGGMGLGVLPLAGILERISRIDAGMAGTLFAHAAALEIISIASCASDCGSIYGMIVRDGSVPLAFQAYADPSEAVAPVAMKKNGNYLLSGRADLLVSGGSANFAVLPGLDPGGALSYFLVDMKDRGIKISDPVLTIGMQSCRPVDMELRDAQGFIIGEEGGGASYFNEAMGRISYASCGILLGIMKGSFDTAREYCAERHQGGRTIIQWGDVRMKLAGMGSLIALAEACVLGLKSMFASGSALAGNSAVACSVHIGQFAADVTSEGIQLLGGNGYMKDYGQEKRMRDAKQAQCLLGSSPRRKIGCIDAVLQEFPRGHA